MPKQPVVGQRYRYKSAVLDRHANAGLSSPHLRTQVWEIVNVNPSLGPVKIAPEGTVAVICGAFEWLEDGFDLISP